MDSTDRAAATGLRVLPRPAEEYPELAEGMTQRLPAGGLAQAAAARRFHLDVATCGLLDRRIVAAASTCLDLELTGPVVAGLVRYQRIRHAARETLEDPRRHEMTVVLVEPHPMSWSRSADVVLTVDRAPVATFPFRLDARVELGQTSVVVRRGAAVEVVCQVVTVSASLFLADVTPPLWTAKREPRPLRLVLRPPVEILASAPAVPPGPATRTAPPVVVPRPRPGRARPPVPGARGRR